MTPHEAWALRWRWLQPLSFGYVHMLGRTLLEARCCVLCTGEKKLMMMGLGDEWEPVTVSQFESPPPATISSEGMTLMRPFCTVNVYLDWLSSECSPLETSSCCEEPSTELWLLPGSPGDPSPWSLRELPEWKRPPSPRIRFMACRCRDS